MGVEEHPRFTRLIGLDHAPHQAHRAPTAPSSFDLRRERLIPAGTTEALQDSFEDRIVACGDASHGAQGAEEGVT